MINFYKVRNIQLVQHSWIQKHFQWFCPVKTTHDKPIIFIGIMVSWSSGNTNTMIHRTLYELHFSTRNIFLVDFSSVIPFIIDFAVFRFDLFLLFAICTENINGPEYSLAGKYDNYIFPHLPV